jgi:predicted anti-sigma-YlaC factor YlaD
MYWVAASHVGAFASDPFDFSLMVDVPLAEKIMARARDLDPAYSGGSIWDFYISFYSGMPESLGGNRSLIGGAYEKALEYAKGRSPSPYISYALAWALPEGDRALFVELLDKALAFDPALYPESRLAMTLALRTAKYYYDRIDELFPADGGEGAPTD